MATIFSSVLADALTHAGPRERLSNSPFLALVKNLKAGTRVAVAEIYDGDSGDVTNLSMLWRDRVEQGIRGQGISVVARVQDLIIVNEDNETYGENVYEELNKAGAEVVVSGRYYIHRASGPGHADVIELQLRATRISGRQFVGSAQSKHDLLRGWQSRAAKVWHNVYSGALEAVANSEQRGPKLKATLNRDPACYPAGGEAVITLESEVGSHLYIINIAADQTATLLYPNRHMPDKPLATPSFEFPPLPSRQSGDMRLELYPLGNRDTRESLKVVASRNPLDFSFLPQPENEVFIGAKGGDMQAMLQLLNKAEDWSDELLEYYVGPGCESASH
jgi:hypothetical protein